jgi:PhoH-like ATPase
MNPSKIYVVDTNVILQNMQNLFRLSDDNQNIVVIPETVLLEMEDKKKLFNDIGFQSREFARFLAKSKVKEIDHNDGFQVLKLEDTNIQIHIISKEKYEAEMTANLAESNDKRIIEVAKLAQHYYKDHEVRFISIDIYARTFALLNQVKTETLHEDKADVPKFEFVKQFNLDSSFYNGLNLSNIHDIDEEHKNENYSYQFVSEDGNSEYAIVVNDKILTVDDSEFNGLSVKPVNMKQKFFLKAVLSNAFNLMVVDAKAGSGKTLLSIASAMRLIDIGAYEKIVYVRNSIESLDKGADVGFLAGNEEKFRVYNMALYDTLEYIARKQLKKSENKFRQEALQSKTDELIDKYNIEMLWPGEARGRTLSNAIVIMDEWQNSSGNTTQLILSRLDDSCMGIVIGSNRQIDNLYLNKFNNGLTTLLKQTKNAHPELNMFAIEFDKAVRGKFAEFTERIFEK